MRTLGNFFKRLLCWLLVLLLAALAAVGACWGCRAGGCTAPPSRTCRPRSCMRPSPARPSFTTCDAIPQTYIDAVIAVEDSRFERHHGVDPLAIVRALWTDLKTKSLAEGGSTLTQQLAKNVYFTQEKHFARKAAELFAAVDIEKHYGKQQIFEMYVNTIYFGSGYYGIAEAAQGLLRQNARRADQCRVRAAGGAAQCAIGLLAQFQPRAGPQAVAGGAGSDGLRQKADEDSGHGAAGRDHRPAGVGTGLKEKRLLPILPQSRLRRASSLSEGALA